MSSNTSTLPLEVVATICALLLRSDLKSVRLVSQAWDEAAQRLLFQTVFLKVNLRSFERLQDISRHHKLSKHVRTIIYDGRKLWDGPATKGFTNWVQSCAGSDLGLYGSLQTNFVDQFSVEQLEVYYFKYCQYLFGQEHILRRGNEQQLLVDALRLLTRLERVEYVAPRLDDSEILYEVPPLNSLSLLAQEILAEPSCDSGDHESNGHFWVLLQSACLAGHGKTLYSVQGSRLHLYQWNTIATPSPTYYKALKALRDLSLEIITTIDDEQRAFLADMISSLPSLLSLHLSFESLLHSQSYDVSLTQIIHSTLTWQYLTKLSLQAVVTTWEAFHDLLSRHSNSLRSLELTDIRFEEAITTINEKKPDYWVLFIIFLAQDMSLTHVKFTREFSNTWNECWWHTSDMEYSDTGESLYSYTEWPTNCLKYRIERYITQGAECPFRSRTENDPRCCSRTPGCDCLSWVFEGDNSWQFVVLT